MQSQRNNLGSYFPTQESALYRSKSNTTNTNKLSVAVQTDHIPKIGKESRFCTFSAMSLDEIKENYVSALCFLNCCHEFINNIFEDSASSNGSSKLEKMIGFRVPEVPNYFSVLDMFLERNCKKRSNQNWIRETKQHIDVNDFRDKVIDDDQIIFDLQQFLPKNIGDGPSSVTNSRGGTRNSGVENINNQCMFRNSEYMRIENDIIKNCGAKKRPSTSSSRLVKSEKDIPKRPSRHELKTLTTTFEEILKTCNEFERQSKEHLFEKDPPLDFYHNSRENMVLEKFQQGDQNMQRKKPETIMNNDTFQTVKQEKNVANIPAPTKSVSDNFNLIEYALKNLKESEYDSDSPRSLSPKSRVTKITPEEESTNPGRGLLTENLPDVLLNFQKVSVTNKKSWRMLNHSQNPKKMNEKISKENFESPGKAESCCDFSDGETFIKFIDNDNSSDDGKEYSNKGFVENFDQNIQENYDVKMVSSSDSIILTDEEFERKIRNGCLILNKEKMSVTTEERTKQGKNPKNDRLVHEIANMPLAKSHPLKLTDKHRSLTNQQVLEKIGIFTEKGDFRPGVISILEEKKRMNFTQNAAKNVQFRTERKFDKMQYTTNQMNQHEKQVSKESLNEKSVIDCPTGSNISIHSSAVSFSSSTVSDSDLLGMEPNNNQTVIKKF